MTLIDTNLNHHWIFTKFNYNNIFFSFQRKHKHSSYSLSGDLKYVLVEYDKQRHYRHSFSAKYSLFNEEKRWDYIRFSDAPFFNTVSYFSIPHWVFTEKMRLNCEKWHNVSIWTESIINFMLAFFATVPNHKYSIS